jgi:hypothetical protein
VLDPSAFEGIAVLINLIEGFSFYTFYSLLVYNLGGAAARDSLTMKASGYAVCGCCLPQDKRCLPTITTTTTLSLFDTYSAL